jgi:Bacteriophage probable baseplate hub protein
MSLPGVLTSATPERPGTSYYVPGVRVAKLQPTLQASGDAGTLLPKGVLGDLIRAEVTRVNSGASQYSLTFNNWFLSTAKDRTQHLDDLGAGNPREAVDGGTNAPYWPRFKYNDFAFLRFGDRLRIDMRYIPEPTGSQRSTDADEKSWTPMVSGPITDIRFSFASGQGAQLTVSGEDDLSALKDKQEKRVPMDRRAEVSIVRQALQKANYPLPLAAPLVDYPSFVTDDGQGIQEALAAGQSTLDFIQKLADRLDFEVFLEFASFDTPTSPLEFHFEPYRGRAVPNESLRPVFRLDRERNLLDFNPTIKVVDQYSSVEVKGRHRDPLVAKEVKGQATHTILDDELHTDASLDGPLKSGPEVRAAFFNNRENKFSVQNQSNLDDVRADWSAKAVIRKKARELFTIDATTIGVPRIRPGNHVEIRGMRPPFDGFYYVSKTVHTFGTDGYRTKVTAARPGMELPPYAVKTGGAA